MSTGTLEGIGTILALLAFTGIVWWAYGSKRKAGFDEAALLPFAEEDDIKPTLPDSLAEPARGAVTHE